MTTSPLITAAELLALLANPAQAATLRVLDTRFDLKDALLGRIAYLEGHVTGAIFADLETDLSGPVQESGAGGRHPLPDPKVLARWLGEQGISNSSRVVVYDDPSGGQGFYAAHAWWLLRWLGHTQVQVLDGGWPAYLAAGGAVSQAESAYTPTTFVPQVQAGWVLNAREVAALPHQTTLLDSRAPERYRGEQESVDRVGGHIPKAANVFWRGSQNEQGHFLPAPVQAARFPSGPLALYCGSGVSACANLLALAVAGREPGPSVQLYAGSWSDWVSDETRPIAVGEDTRDV